MSVPATRTEPASMRVEAGDAVEERRLADARLADDGDELAGAEDEVDAFEDRARAVALGETGDLEDGSANAGLPRPGDAARRDDLRRSRRRVAGDDLAPRHRRAAR